MMYTYICVDVVFYRDDDNAPFDMRRSSRDQRSYDTMDDAKLLFRKSLLPPLEEPLICMRLAGTTTFDNMHPSTVNSIPSLKCIQHYSFPKAHAQEHHVLIPNTPQSRALMNYKITTP
jgi:hypothetical protein